MHVFGILEEAGGPTHLQTPHRKASGDSTQHQQTVMTHHRAAPFNFHYTQNWHGFMRFLPVLSKINKRGTLAQADGRKTDDGFQQKYCFIILSTTVIKTILFSTLCKSQKYFPLLFFIITAEIVNIHISII